MSSLDIPSLRRSLLLKQPLEVFYTVENDDSSNKVPLNKVLDYISLRDIEKAVTRDFHNTFTYVNILWCRKSMKRKGIAVPRASRNEVLPDFSKEKLRIVASEQKGKVFISFFILTKDENILLYEKELKDHLLQQISDGAGENGHTVKKNGKEYLFFIKYR